MSKVSLGSIEGLAVNGNTITVPTGHTIKQTGAVLQVVQANLTSATSIGFSGQTGTPTTSNTVSIMTCSITPKYSTSKILVMGNIRYSTNNSTPALVIFRDTTPVGIGDASSVRRRSTTGTGYHPDTNQIGGHGSLSYLDSPATTSVVTYDVRMWSDGGTTYVNRAANDADSTTGVRSISNLILMEIAQ